MKNSETSKDEGNWKIVTNQKKREKKEKAGKAVVGSSQREEKTWKHILFWPHEFFSLILPLFLFSTFCESQ